MEEISKYSRYLAVIISKCDKKNAELTEEVKTQVETTLSMAGMDYPVITTNKFDPQLPDKFLTIFDNFNAQAIFDEKMKETILSEVIIMCRSLEIAKEKAFLDTYEIRKEIQKYEGIKQRVRDVFAVQKKKINATSASMTNEVMDAVRGALLSNADRVADAILSGGTTGLEAIIVGIIRPVLIESMKSFSNQQIHEVVKALCKDFDKVFSKDGDSKSLSDIITQTAVDFKKLIDNGTFTKALGKYADKENEQKDQKNRNIYHIATTIAALATDIIAPWLEIIIILLPDIISILKSIFSESDRAKIKKAFVNNIVPQIIEKMYSEVETVITETQDMLLTALEKEFEEKISGIQETLDALQKKKEGKELEFDQHKALIETHLNQLYGILNDMKEN